MAVASWSRMGQLRVSFDRGTLRLDGDVGALGAAADDAIRFDARAGFHRASSHLYTALLEHARERGLEVDDRVRAAWCVARAPSAPPELRPYQEQALAAFERLGRRGVIALPTGSGKTRTACAALARSGQSAVVLVPTRVLLDQWISVLRAQFGDPIGAFGDGMRSVSRLTVMTFESAYRCLDRFGDRFAMVVVDEAHHFAGGARAEALEMCPAPVRLGLSATPPVPGSAGAERLRELIGPVVFQLEIADLAGRDLAALELVRLPVALTPAERAAYDDDIAPFTSWRRELRRANPDADWLSCVQAIARVPGGAEVLARMHRARDLAAFPTAKRACVRALLARHRSDRALLFTAAASHAYALAEQELIPVITAEVARRERDAILAAFRERRVRAICSARVLNEGLDVPDANVAIIIAGALGAREHVQRIGRILRPGEGKRAIAYELVTLDTIDELRVRARRRSLVARRVTAGCGA
jgi:superfamily II DNA or RNA helicase